MVRASTVDADMTQTIIEQGSLSACGVSLSTRLVRNITRTGHTTSRGFPSEYVGTRETITASIIELAHRTRRRRWHAQNARPKMIRTSTSSPHDLSPCLRHAQGLDEVQAGARTLRERAGRTGLAGGGSMTQFAVPVGTVIEDRDSGVTAHVDASGTLVLGEPPSNLPAGERFTSPEDFIKEYGPKSLR